MEKIATASGSATFASSASAEDVRALIARREERMRARDAAAIVADYAADVVKFDLAPPLRSVGVDPAGLQAWMDGFEGELEYEVHDLAIETSEGMAFGHSLNRLSATPRGTNFRFTLWFRATLCLRRTPDGWKIAHEHNSTPFYMDGSLRAATDLTP